MSLCLAGAVAFVLFGRAPGVGAAGTGAVTWKYNYGRAQVMEGSFTNTSPHALRGLTIYAHDSELIRERGFLVGSEPRGVVAAWQLPLTIISADAPSQGPRLPPIPRYSSEPIDLAPGESRNFTITGFSHSVIPVPITVLDAGGSELDVTQALAR